MRHNCTATTVLKLKHKREYRFRLKLVYYTSGEIIHPVRLYKIVIESKYGLYLVKGMAFATNIYVNERECIFMFLLTYADLHLIKFFIKNGLIR